MTDPRRDYLDQILRSGVSLPPALAAAFASVPREAFVPEGFQRRDGSWVHPADPDFLATVYRDDVLITKVDGKVPISSSSQPSLMAIMLMALGVTPGMRVLEIGAGTGYNAALLAALGATVTSIDVQADVADRARSALARAGVAGVRVQHADGYAGLPGERFDRVIVTVGIGGLSPHWLEQLDPGGLVIAPVKQAGTHPVLAVADPSDARVVCASGFMAASGPLNADHPYAFPAPAPAGALTGLVQAAPSRFDPPLTEIAYRDLWFAAGAWSHRATHALLPSTALLPGTAVPSGVTAVPGRDQSCLALLDEPRTGGAVVLPDGTVLAGGHAALRYGAMAVEIIDRWIAAGRPPMQAWRVGLTLTGEDKSPIWAPHTWELRP
ncbi:protein-L-isoaspartate O-methyltransferase family protein [Actinoplanes sp. CA-030573]|uniref:protein-L-isoaspartate O-methyltransferase family protein n=1 Tax=Actinoplanes sp. CA-030573 TaxID=3239898 RepID=UPI003D93AA99